MLLRQYKRVRSVKGEKFTYNDVKNVYLIVIYENSPKEFRKLPKDYYHYGKQVFDTGLELNLLQEFIMIPLDIFRKNMENKSIETHLEAWLMFLTNDNPERVIELITKYPEFKPMYETVYQMCQNVEGVMNMFSEELRILDQNTVKYMIEEQEQEIERQKAELEEKTEEIVEYKKKQRDAIENLLKENMSVEKVATILSCDVSYVEEIKREMQQ